ncbi:MAG: DNA-3-methyladenine glycosylase I [Bacilli bacterium]|jgi:DNA-3-methyladenine glycosylase I|nr:DNA-3-methyladenine glycosylase I [Bacilli bacterium]
MNKNTKKRCRWANPNNTLYIQYHDHEWGVPTYDDQMLFELLILESFQAGLSWECILNKRAAFREAFDQFVVEKVSCYDERKVEDLLGNAKIIRNRLKIKAAIQNANIFKLIQQEYGTFSHYIWHFTHGEVVYEIDQTRSSLSDIVSSDLKQRGMKFVGTTIIYSYLQAIGIIYSHEKDCFLYRTGEETSR